MKTARELLQLFANDRERLQTLGRAAGSAHRIHLALQASPITTIGAMAAKTGLSEMTCGTSLRQLEKLNIVRELTGGKYGRLFAYQRYLDILSEGTAPLR